MTSGVTRVTARRRVIASEIFSLEVARHEAFALLDQAAQEPRLGRPRVGRLTERKPSGVVDLELRLVEPDTQGRQ